jgi:hypothetical protein
MNGVTDLDIIPCKGMIVCCIVKAETGVRGGATTHPYLSSYAMRHAA